MSAALAGCGGAEVLSQAASPVAVARSGLAVESLEINQVLGKLPNPKYVAGKSTAVIAYLSAEVTPNPEAHKVVVSVDGAEAFTLTPLASATPTRTLVFTCREASACGSWKAGAYRFDATIDGVSATASGTFVAKRPVRILAVPVKARYGTDVRSPDEKWKRAGEFMRSVWPVADAAFSWSLREEIDLTAHDITTDDGQRAVWKALADLNPNRCETEPQADGCYDAVMGFIKSRIGDMQGYTFGAPAVVNVNDDEDMMATVVHEFAHMAPFKLGDEYRKGSYNCDHNPPPPDYVGSNFNNREQKSFSCTASPEVSYDVGGARSGAGSTIPAALHAYDFSRGLLPDTLCFMGSGSAQANFWVTPKAYDHLWTAAAPIATASFAPVATGQVVELSGWLKKDAGAATGFSAAVEPWFTFEGPLPEAPATPSDFTVKAYDASNAVLASANLEAVFEALDPVRELSQVAIDGAIPFAAGTVRFDVMKGGAVLASVPVSANAPVVSVTAPAAGATLSGKGMLRWQGSDADGNSLTYMVEYCESSTSGCEVLASGLTATELETDFDALPGSATAFVRITATDGVRTVSAQSGTFQVAVKAPEIEILEPDADEKFPAGQELVFDAQIFDEQDDAVIAPAQLKWTSDVAGELGSGARIYTQKLKPGPHVVTLIATNSKGVSSTATVRVTVEGAADTGSPGDTAETVKKGCGCGATPAAGLLPWALVAGGLLVARRRMRRA